MKKTIQIIGIGQRRSGVSKSGNSYDFVPVAVSYEDKKNFQGVRCCEMNIETADFEEARLNVGDVREVFMHVQNFRMVLDGIL